MKYLIPYIALLIFLTVRTTWGFLPTKLNYSDPAVDAIFCPNQNIGPTWNLKAITREAIRREVRRLFLEEPPEGQNGTFTLPENYSLTKLFRAYYGDSASPIRFYKAVNTIAWANAETDSNTNSKYDTSYHFEAEGFAKAQERLAIRYNGLINSIQKKAEFGYAKQLLGTTLHAIQDFYAYTTWIELGNKEPLPGLGTPVCDFGDVAGPEDSICIPCQNAQGQCKHNVIAGSKLSSGYYVYESDEGSDFVVPKPTGDKCSHGGSLDTSSSSEPKGGINKATSSPCYSPHNHLHKEAAEMAVASSEEFLGSLRSQIGNNNFRRLLDLYTGSSLSIVIDITDSMSHEIDQVKKQTHEIVEKSKPELLILVPYGDPYTKGSETVTSDPEEFLSAVDALQPSIACCCVQEPFWTAVDVAIANTPDYSSIYVFTDAGANDADYMDGVMARAELKHIRITIIYSYSTYKNIGPRFGKYKNIRETYIGHDGESHTEIRKEYNYVETKDPPCAFPTTNETHYKQLASMTGGQFITIDKVDIDSIINVIGGEADAGLAYIRIANEITGARKISFPVDENLQTLVIKITRATTKAVLTLAQGTMYDLMDKEFLESQNNVNIKVYSDTLKNIEIIFPEPGALNLETDSSNYYDISISGLSILDFLADFTLMDITPPRPNYHLIPGRPIFGEIYYVEVMLVGWIESLVRDIESMVFVDLHGNTLSHIPYTEDEVDDEVYIQSSPLPKEDFYIMINGYLSTGDPFSRIYPTLMLPVDLSVDINLLTAHLEGLPGSYKTAEFEVKNLGPEDEYKFKCRDELGFVKTVSPTHATLESNAGKVVKVTFMVPSDATPYDVSQFTFTATNSRASSFAMNNFLVLPKDVDFTAPTCTTSDTPDCSGYTEDDCESGTWTVNVEFQDKESGIYSVFSKPKANLIVSGLQNGTTDPIKADYTVNCCVTKAEIIAVDEQGNQGKCVFQLDDLQAGFFVEFAADSVGSTWVNLRWTVSQKRDDLLKYSVQANQLFNYDVICYDLTCYMNITNLKPCFVQHFELTPYFLNNNGQMDAGTSEQLEVLTLEEAPGAPKNPTVDATDDTGVSISWASPEMNSCITGYQVCYHMIGQDISDQTCKESTETTYLLDELEPCTIYYVTIASKSNSGALSEIVTLDLNSQDAVPGKPENLRIYNMTLDGIVCMEWDAPLNTRHCADKYMVSVKHHDGKGLTMRMVRSEFKSCVDGIAQCSNYTFSVSTVSPANKPGGTASINTATPESEPSSIINLDVVPESTTSIFAAWAPDGAENCVDHYRMCSVNVETAEEICHNTNDYDYTFTDLLPCSKYEISAVAVSPKGHFGFPVFGTGSTHDIAPGPVLNLKVIEKTGFSVKIAYESPNTNPSCAKEQDISVVEVSTAYYSAEETIHPKTYRSNHNFVDNLDGLEPCTLYNISVNFKSPTGISGPLVGIQSTTEVVEPTVPTRFQIMDVTETYALMQWFAPEVGKNCIEKYELSWTGGDKNGKLEFNVGNVVEVPARMDNLTPCTEYNLSLIGITQGGTFKTQEALQTFTTLCSF